MTVRAMDTDALASVRTEATSVVVYFRNVYLPNDRAPDPYYVRPDRGRWATEWTLYTADAEHVAWAEYCRQAASEVDRGDPTGGIGINPANFAALRDVEVRAPLPLRSLFTITIQFDALADLTDRENQRTLATAGFSLRDFYEDDYGGCPDIARSGEALGWEGLQAPSAAWRPDGRCIALFQAGRRRILRDRMVAEAARPTVSVAAGTTYKHNQRPSWLPVF
jgi:RES domain